ncbi:MAG TPA: zf-HC2 domain-containing protein [Candidatus Acidoferrales bacterium]|nr:zf-HC2 domain-containing protein [Candidatus Acidoferrales bacterium]
MKSKCYNVFRADDFVHGELDQSEQDEFKLHLETCDECRSEVEHLHRLAGTLNAAHSFHLDERFNYSVVSSIRQQRSVSEGKELRIALEDIVISLATLLVIVILGLQMFERPTISPVEMVGSLTNIERSSVDQETLSNDQVLELVVRSK